MLHPLSSSSPSVYTSFSSSTSSLASFLLLLLLLLLLQIRRRQHLEKSPSPFLWYHYWIITVIYHHLSLSATLSTYYGGRTSLPMTFSPLLSQPILYEGINYYCYYDGGSSDFPGLFLSQSCISYPQQVQVFIKIHGAVEGECLHSYLHHPFSRQEGWWWRPLRQWGERLVS